MFSISPHGSPPARRARTAPALGPAKRSRTHRPCDRRRRRRVVHCRVALHCPHQLGRAKRTVTPCSSARSSLSLSVSRWLGYIFTASFPMPGRARLSPDEAANRRSWDSRPSPRWSPSRSRSSPSIKASGTRFRGTARCSRTTGRPFSHKSASAWGFRSTGRKNCMTPPASMTKVARRSTRCS